MFKKVIYSTIIATSLFLSGCGTTGNGLLGNVLGGGTMGTTNGTSSVLGSVLGGSSSTSTGGGLLGGVLGSVINSNTASGLLDMVIGHVKLSQTELVGTWVYSEPGCAFTSENLLAKAGGSVAATQVKQKLLTAYNSLGISSQNTGFAFDQQGNFEGYIKGLPLKGTYTLDTSNGKLNLKTALFTVPAFVTRTTNGLSITMESKKLLSTLKTLMALTGNSTLTTIGNLGDNFDGVRLGFDVVKYQ